jgi:hypothetical protein
MFIAPKTTAPLALVALFAAACGPVAPPGAPKDPAPPSPPPTPTAPASAPTPVTAEPEAPEPPPAGESDVALLPAGTHDGYFVSRAPLGPEGREVVMAARDTPTSAEEAEVVLAITQGGAVLSRQEGLAAIAGEKALARIALGRCERVETRARRIPLGKDVEGLRLSFLCAQGEDYFSSSELALVIRLGADIPADVTKLERLWVGPGDQVDVEMDACEKASHVTFALVDANTLERRVEEKATWSAQVGGQIEPGVAANIKAGCKVTGKKTRSERIRVPAK